MHKLQHKNAIISMMKILNIPRDTNEVFKCIIQVSRFKMLFGNINLSFLVKMRHQEPTAHHTKPKKTQKKNKMPKEMKRGHFKGVGVSVSISTYYFTTKQPRYIDFPHI